MLLENGIAYYKPLGFPKRKSVQRSMFNNMRIGTPHIAENLSHDIASRQARTADVGRHANANINNLRYS